MLHTFTIIWLTYNEHIQYNHLPFNSLYFLFFLSCSFWNVFYYKKNIHIGVIITYLINRITCLSHFLIAISHSLHLSIRICDAITLTCETFSLATQINDFCVRWWHIEIAVYMFIYSLVALLLFNYFWCGFVIVIAIISFSDLSPTFHFTNYTKAFPLAISNC